jgi:hypothetical protein
MKYKYLLTTILALGLMGCDEAPTTNKVDVTPRVASTTNQVEKVEEFVITSKGKFKAGYGNEEREILLIKETATGEEYLAITDCAMIRRVKAAKEAKNEAVNTVVDVLSDLSDSGD